MEANGRYEFDSLPGAEINGAIRYHVWGIARVGDASVGESDFIEDGPQVEVIEVTVDLFDSSIPLSINAVPESTLRKIAEHVAEMVGENVLAEMLWDSMED